MMLEWGEEWESALPSARKLGDQGEVSLIRLMVTA